MAFRVFRVPPNKRDALESALRDDLVSRQSITTREARHYGDPGEDLFVFVEGDPDALFRVDALFLEFAERAKDHMALYRRLKEEEDEAASGLGSIFPE